jgi:hypothetical protein
MAHQSHGHHNLRLLNASYRFIERKLRQNWNLSTTSSGEPTVTVDYKKFDVELAFIPTVLARGVIYLRISRCGRKTIPVHLSYLIAFVDDHGKLKFRNNIYGRDHALRAFSKELNAKLLIFPSRTMTTLYGGSS